MDNDISPFSFWDGRGPGPGLDGRGDGGSAYGYGETKVARAEGGRGHVFDQGNVGAAAGEEEGEEERRGEKSSRREQRKTPYAGLSDGYVYCIGRGERGN